MSEILNIEEIKSHFPIFHNRERPFVYLDSAASSQKPLEVIESMSYYYANYHANVHRGVYEIAECATQMYEDARKKLGRFIHAKYPETEIVFTRNATEALNLVAYSLSRSYLKRNDKVVLSLMEHHANIVPWLIAKEQLDLNICYIGLDEQGYLDLSDIESLLSGAKVVSLTMASNVLGTINDLKYLSRLSHENGALFVVDGAQGVPHFEVNVEDLDIDFLAITGHKMLGPTGIGALYGKKHLLEELPCFNGGGEMIKDVKLDSFVANDVPWKFEAGTPPIAEAIGLSRAIDFLEKIGMNNIRDHEIEITKYALEALNKHFEGVLKTYGPKNTTDRNAAISFSIKDIHPHDVSQVLDSYGICVRAGHHCAKPLMRHLGLSATTRASFYIYNDFDDVDSLVKGINQVMKFFK